MVGTRSYGGTIGCGKQQSHCLTALAWKNCTIFEIFRGVIPTSDPILLKSIAIHLPFLSRCYCKRMHSSWLKVVCTPPICITIRLPFVSQYLCRSLRVRGRWSTPKICEVARNVSRESLSCSDHPCKDSYCCGSCWQIQPVVEKSLAL